MATDQPEPRKPGTRIPGAAYAGPPANPTDANNHAELPNLNNPLVQRDALGRWLPGQKAHYGRTNRLRELLRQRVSLEAPELVDKLFYLALRMNDRDSLHYIFDQTIGKPVQAIEVDTSGADAYAASQMRMLAAIAERLGKPMPGMPQLEAPAIEGEVVQSQAPPTNRGRPKGSKDRTPRRRKPA